MASHTDAAAVVLEGAGPLDCAAITQAAVDGGLLMESDKAAQAAMKKALEADMRKKGKRSQFVRAGPGRFALRAESEGGPPAPAAGPPEAGPAAEEPAAGGPRAGPAGRGEKRPAAARARPVRTSAKNPGRAGQHMVAGELLARGIGAAVMEGGAPEVVAEGAEGTYGITVNLSGEGDARVRVEDVESVRNEAYARQFYVFVVRAAGGGARFIVLPLEILEHCTENGFEREAGGSLVTAITEEGGRTYLGGPENDVTYFVDNWDRLK